jgi:dienelactone hydrolase
MYSYDAAPLEARLERSDTTRDWVRERVSFTAAYGSERMAAYLYLPRRGRPPYQVVVYWPGSQVLQSRQIDSRQMTDMVHGFFAKAGRAVVLPQYNHTFGRDLLPGALFPPPLSSGRRDMVIQWVKDLRRTVDYVATRTDLDSTRLAFYGHSWGGDHMPIVLAVEPRIKAGVCFTCGLSRTRLLPEVDSFNFLPGVRTPLLILASRYDPVFPFETSQKPMFERAGMPVQDKAMFVYDKGAHYMPMDIVARESLAWLNRYLGPVRFEP